MTSPLIAKIQAAYQREQQLNREAITAQDLPLSYETITDRWLTAVLCAEAPGAVVNAHRLSEPDNGSANRRKIYLEYNQVGQAAGLPQAVFCKATHDLANRFVLGISGGARCETLFYADIRPWLDIEAPVGYFASFNAETINSIVILGDLSDTVQSFCDHKTVMTRQRVESQLRQLAKFHGQCFKNAELKNRIGQLPTFREFFTNTLGFGMKEGSTAGFLVADSVIPPRLYRRIDAIWPATLTAIENLDRLPHTLAHGDVHLKNWYVAGSGEMGLSDWQCAARAHWGRDVAYTISCALSVENRRAWERDLLKYYLEQLAIHGGATTDFNSAWNIYRQMLIPALTWWTITLRPSEGLPDMQPKDVTLDFIRRMSTAMDDLDSLDLD